MPGRQTKSDKPASEAIDDIMNRMIGEQMATLATSCLPEVLGTERAESLSGLIKRAAVQARRDLHRQIH